MRFNNNKFNKMNIQEQYNEETGLYHYDSGSMDFKWSDDYVEWLEKRIEALTFCVNFV